MTATALPLTTAELVGHFREGTPEWNAAREGAITGSRIAAVLGLSLWESPFSLWHRMMGVASEQPVSDLMHWGTKLEPLIMQEYADRRSITGHQLVTKPGLFRNSERPWQMVTPDGLNGNRIVEAKYSPMTDGWGDEGTDEIPVYYRAQALWSLDTFGFDEADVCVWFGGSAQYREYVVTRDTDDITLMRERAQEFRASLNGGQRPAIDGHDATYHVIREMHPDIDDEKVDIPGGIAAAYLSALTAMEIAEDQKSQSVAEMLDAMGRARRAYFQGEQIAMRIPGRPGKPPFLRPTASKPYGQTIRGTAA